MKKNDYFVGLDIGTDSTGYAVTDDMYKLLYFHGERMWGAHLFDAAQPAAERRVHRTARRRLDRSQWRVRLLRELFASAIVPIDSNFLLVLMMLGSFVMTSVIQRTQMQFSTM